MLEFDTKYQVLSFFGNQYRKACVCDDVTFIVPLFLTSNYKGVRLPPKDHFTIMIRILVDMP
jgi:hypothetical protein